MPRLNHQSRMAGVVRVCAGGLLLGGLATSASASILVNADFGAGYTANASLSGQSGSSDVRLAGTWNTNVTGSADHASQLTVLAATGSNNLTYNVSGGGTLSSTNVLQFVSNSGAVVQWFGRNLSSSISGQDVYARLLLKPVNGSYNSGTRLNWFMYAGTSNPGAGNTSLSTGLGQLGQGTTNSLATQNLEATIGTSTTNNAIAKATPGITNGTVDLLVAKYAWDATSKTYNSVSFWLNPAYGDSATPIATASITSGNANLGQLGLTTANLSAAGGTGSVTYDFANFAVGTTWQDVVPAAVPEPASLGLALVGLGLLAGGWRPRRSA